jgi:hypothetical protein
MVETHKDLSAIPISMFSEEQSSNVSFFFKKFFFKIFFLKFFFQVGLFREVLEILDTGLTLDRPLKQQVIFFFFFLLFHCLFFVFYFFLLDS